MAKRVGVLTESERQTFIHCFHVAADQFEKDAAVILAQTGFSTRMSECFNEQAKTARLWAEQIESAHEVIIK
jgi:hypothetical protein